MTTTNPIEQVTSQLQSQMQISQKRKVNDAYNDIQLNTIEYTEHIERMPEQRRKIKVKISQLIDDIEEPHLEELPQIESLDSCLNTSKCSSCIYSSGDLPSIQCIITNKCRLVLRL